MVAKKRGKKPNRKGGCACSGGKVYKKKVTRRKGGFYIPLPGFATTAEWARKLSDFASALYEYGPDVASRLFNDMTAGHGATAAGALALTPLVLFLGYKTVAAFKRRLKSASPTELKTIAKKIERAPSSVLEQLAAAKPGRSGKQAHLSKYRNRPSPPYAANDSSNRGKTRKGNDGRSYRSKRASNGVYRWVVA